MRVRKLSATGRQLVDDVARRHDFSPAAAQSMLESMLAGSGGMAQFNHPEFGGSGQWMRGGMTMVSDMFNTTLKSRVERLCNDLAQLVAEDATGEHAVFEPDADHRESQTSSRFAPYGGLSQREEWWPADLGQPAATGAQNNMRYAYFSEARRLAIDHDGSVTVYDTLEHRIRGVSQQQSGHGSQTFASQQGIIDVASLPVVSGEPEPQGRPDVPEPQGRPGEPEPQGRPDVLATIEKLAELHRKGIVTETEFAAKKSELLHRL